jgi:hypothetical protein
VETNHEETQGDKPIMQILWWYIIDPALIAIAIMLALIYVRRRGLSKRKIPEALQELPDYVLKQVKVFNVSDQKKYIVYPYPTVNGEALPEPTSLFSTKRFYLSAILITIIFGFAIYWVFTH